MRLLRVVWKRAILAFRTCFPGLGRAYAKREIGLLLVSANDFKADAWLHSRMAILRGVEGGFRIARAARNGVLTLSNNRGAVVAEAHSDAAAFSTLVGSVAILHRNTLYSRGGDWFAWLNLGVLAVTLAMGRRTKAQTANPPASAVSPVR